MAQVWSPPAESSVTPARPDTVTGVEASAANAHVREWAEATYSTRTRRLVLRSPSAMSLAR
jgi:hypothetical protein